MYLQDRYATKQIKFRTCTQLRANFAKFLLVLGKNIKQTLIQNLKLLKY